MRRRDVPGDVVQVLWVVLMQFTFFVSVGWNRGMYCGVNQTCRVLPCVDTQHRFTTMKIYRR